MPQHVSDGRVFEQRHVELDVDDAAWPSPLTCVYPSTDQCEHLATLIRAKCQQVVSIGCGEGAAERALEHALEQCNVPVVGVDVHAMAAEAAYANMRCFLARGIHRVRPDQLYRIGDHQEEATCLCFFWGRCVPWRAYLELYQRIPLVCIIGELLPPNAASDERSCATQPCANALDEWPDEWRCIDRRPVRAIHGGAVLSVYERVSGGASTLLSLPALPEDLQEALLAHFLSVCSFLRVRQVCKSWQTMVDKRAAKLTELRFGPNTSAPPPGLNFHRVDDARHLITPLELPPFPRWGHVLERADGSAELQLVGAASAGDGGGAAEPAARRVHVLRALCWSSVVIEQLSRLAAVPNSQLLFAPSCGIAPLVCHVRGGVGEGSLVNLYYQVAKAVLSVSTRGCLWHGERIDEAFWTEHLRPKGGGPRVDEPGGALKRLFSALESPNVLMLNDTLGTLQCMPQVCIGLLPGTDVLVGFVAAATFVVS